MTDSVNTPLSSFVSYGWCPQNPPHNLLVRGSNPCGGTNYRRLFYRLLLAPSFIDRFPEARVILSNFSS